MQTSYRIANILEDKITLIDEYWDEFVVFNFIVFAAYRGGNIVEFMQNNSCLRNPNFGGLNKFINL